MYSFGWCKGIDDAEMLCRLGFDYIECTVTSLKLEDKSEFEKVLPKYTESPLPVLAFNVFFPGGLYAVGPDTDSDRIRNYVSKAAYALNRIGARIVVLGSGRARNVPDGWEREHAEEQFLQLLDWMGDEFDGTGVTVAIEPLNKQETNLINSVCDAAAFARQVNRPSIRVLADFYHMDEENEPLDTLVEHKDWLAHIHLADTGRLSPGTGQYPYEQFAQILKKTGYSGLISAECSVKHPEEELPAALEFMKNRFGYGPGKPQP
ncbi:sugar phosphate isomerase/epimerase family protein [Paenibacillus sp. OAS669]|uniref:sugar phosphate isomerase/epimerase family protein n=1 Tax=Paenibacillus sp. OAS669 TaxID=2663821 RepID=UPI00178C104E|nr:sugar phosphate isomerase/epimerase family protein [Paenibacillus sp. OAS669]MBE1440907.1 sugar phosphate isomerase/epimerase [Paenibacillus sp. OAS669]